MPAPAKFDDLKVFAFPTPGANNFVLRVRRDPSAAKYERLAEGTDIAECNFMQMRDTENEAYEGFLLTKIVPGVTEQQHVEDWFFVRPWTDQNEWNWTTKYLDESSEHPAIQRSSVILREDYEEQENGADADPVFNGYTLLSQEQVRHEDPVIDALFVVAVRTYAPLPGALRPGALKGDLQTAIPPEFRREIDIGIEMTKVPTGTAADTGADILESQVVPESVAMAEKRTYRISTEFPVELVESEITNEGQVATVTKTLAEGPQSITPSATVSGKVENRGGGITIKTEVVVPEVFDNSRFQVERPDLLPPEFRAAVPLETTVVDSAGTAAMPTLGEGDVAASSEQVTEFVRRNSVSSRDLSEPPTLTGEKTTSEYGGTVSEIVRDVVDESDPADSGEEILDSEVSPIGGGKAIKTTVRRPAGEAEWPELEGFVYNDQFEVSEFFTQQVVEAGSVAAAPGVEVTPIDRWRDFVKAFDLTETREALAEVHFRVGTQVPVQLPDVLTGVEVLWGYDGGDGSVDTTIHQIDASFQVVGAKEDSSAAEGEVLVAWTAGFDGMKAGVEHFFFLPITAATLEDLLDKAECEMWPELYPQGHEICVLGGAKRKQDKNTKNYGLYAVTESAYALGLLSETDDESFSAGRSARTKTIPPMLHGEITITEDSVGSLGSLGAAHSFFPATLPATTPAAFPAGTYLVGTPSISPYKHGMVLVNCKTVTI